ncbi:MAG: hypothetical protein IKR56_00210 [Lachnospiraceae bacterium]|nr:hypothetical protein [Lachnospiraceae bacterium]
MTLLITVFAAVASTAVWYFSKRARTLKVSMLVFMFWGASLMWFVDGIAGYLEDGADYFVPSAADMLNDAFLGVSVIALALVIWMVSLLIKDPEGTLATSLRK